jgi:hypothetical protein
MARGEEDVADYEGKKITRSGGSMYP